MTPDWTRLAPHRPLDPGAASYQVPPFKTGEGIARWVLAGGSTVLVGGPAGVGKSTELAHVAYLLQQERVACLVSVDRSENMRRITPDQLLLRIAGKLVGLAVSHLKLPVSASLREMLCSAGVLPESFVDSGLRQAYGGDAADLIRLTLNEVSRVSRQGRVALVLDGLEKLPEGPGALEIFDALGTLPDNVDIVTVVPWHVAFGPQAAEPLLRVSERFVSVRAPEVEGQAGAPGRAFLRAVLCRRVGAPFDAFDPAPSPNRVAKAWLAETRTPAHTTAIVEQAAVLSGGIPRTFLQLVADAGTYAKLRRSEDWPNETDMADAIADQQDSFRRILLPGDRAVLNRFEGTDGLEMDPGIKVRMLAHGLMLERQVGPGVVLRMHPLVTPIVLGGGDA